MEVTAAFEKTSPPKRHLSSSGLAPQGKLCVFFSFSSSFLCFSLLATVYEIGANNTLYNWTSSTGEAGTSCRKKPMSKRLGKLLFTPISKSKNPLHLEQYPVRHDYGQETGATHLPNCLVYLLPTVHDGCEKKGEIPQTACLLKLRGHNIKLRATFSQGGEWAGLCGSGTLKLGPKTSIHSSNCSPDTTKPSARTKHRQHMKMFSLSVCNISCFLSLLTNFCRIHATHQLRNTHIIYIYIYCVYI